MLECLELSTIFDDDSGDLVMITHCDTDDGFFFFSFLDILILKQKNCINSPEVSRSNIRVVFDNILKLAIPKCLLFGIDQSTTEILR